MSQINPLFRVPSDNAAVDPGPNVDRKEPVNPDGTTNVTPSPPSPSQPQSNADLVALDRRLVRGALLGDVVGIATSILLGFGVNAATDLLPGALAFGLTSFLTAPLGAGLGARIAGRGSPGHADRAVGRAFLFTTLIGGGTLLATTLLGVAGSGDPEFALVGGLILGGVVNAIVAPIGALRGFRGGRPAARAESPTSPPVQKERFFTLTLAPSATPHSLEVNMAGQF